MLHKILADVGELRIGELKSSRPVSYRSLAVIVTHEGPRGAVVVTRQRSLRFGMENIERLKRSTELSATDRRILARASGNPRGCVAVVFRACGALEGQRFGFDSDNMGVAQGEELAYFFLQAQLPIHRRLMGAGVRVVVHGDWGEFEFEVFHSALTRLIGELDFKRGESTVEEASAGVDHWILKNATFYFLSFLARAGDEEHSSGQAAAPARAGEAHREAAQGDAGQEGLGAPA